MLGVIVCGGRHFDRYDVIEKVLNEVLSTSDDQEIEIVSGHCEGGLILLASVMPRSLK